MRILITVLIVTSICVSQTIYFEDDFEDGNADGWFEFPSGGTYEVNGEKRYQMSYVGSTNDYCLALRGDVDSVTMSVPDYSVCVEIRGHYPTNIAGVNLRFNVADSTSYACYLNWDLGSFYIGRYDSFYTWTTLTVHSVPGGLNYDTPYWMRFECEDQNLRAKLWQGTAGDEPSMWLLMAVDYTYNANGCIDLDTSGNTPNFDFDVEFDNVTVTPPLTALEQTTWGGIKAAQYM